MKLQKIINRTFEDEVALINPDTNEVLMKGDAYHDKIDERIEGFLEGLSYANIKYTSIDDKSITPNNPLFSICDFSNEEYDDYCEEEEFDLFEDMDGDDEADAIIASGNIRIQPYVKKHRFKIVSTDIEISLFGDIIHALKETTNCDGDLFLTDDDQYSIVYSCQGLELDDNNDCLKEFGVYYDEYNELCIRNEGL